MKRISEKKGLAILRELKDTLAAEVREGYEHRAKSCDVCETPGACCLDEHFVNVHISPLEGEAIIGVLEGLPEDRKVKVLRRVDAVIEKYGLEDGEDTFDKTYACPLFEKGTGCLVHGKAKPVPCIVHACYERKEDLPPASLAAEREIEVDELNRRVYGRRDAWLPLPVMLIRRAKI